MMHGCVVVWLLHEVWLLPAMCCVAVACCVAALCCVAAACCLMCGCSLPAQQAADQQPHCSIAISNYSAGSLGTRLLSLWLLPGVLRFPVVVAKS
jgi:hypothetical protein